VAGIIGASGKNNEGIQGVINDGNICFINARVFGENDGGTRMSAIFEAIEWLVDEGAKVINLSLGVDTYVTAGEALTKAAYDAGALLVAAAGNSGTEAAHYPANYMNVLSVAAVDANQERATFSQYNSGVDVAAPGVDILSTLPHNRSSAIFLSSESVRTTGIFFANSVQYTKPISGSLVLCPNFGNETCPGSGGHICLIER
jgi:subtilisin family serine protease